MNKYLFLGIVFLIIIIAIVSLVCMTKNNGKTLYKMADIFETDIFSDLNCFNECLESCIVERVPELSEDQKVTCEQECGLLCSKDAPIFRF